jgi:hypothetical protein
MTDPEAKEMLALLSKHFGEPVLPLGKVCNAVYGWMRCIEEANARAKLTKAWAQGSNYSDHLTQIRHDIMKSALMGRLIYGGEKVRTKMCPLHHGKQEMHIHLGAEPQCPHECDGTGWLREP